MQCDNFVLNNLQAQFVDKYKYLGHETVTNLEDDEDIDKQHRQLDTIGNVIIQNK